MSERNLYSEIIATTDALIVVLDAEGRIVMFNKACERTSGYSFKEVRGRTVWDFLLTPDEREPVKAVFQDLRAGHFPNTFQNHWVTRTGALRFIEWSNSAVTDERGQVVHVIGTGIDVTDRRDAEAQLRENQERFQVLASAIPLVLWIIDPASGRVPYISSGFERIWGRALPDADTAFEVFRNSIHPDDGEAMFRQFQKESESSEAGESEYRIVRPDGEVRWIHSRAFPVKDDHGNVNCIVGYAEDITARKRTEQALYEAQQRERALLDSIPDAAWLKDARGVYVEVNRGFLDRYGLEASEVVGKTTFELFPREVAERYAAEEAEVIRSRRSLLFEHSSVVKGETRWFEVIRSPVLDAAGRVTGITGVSRDITERKLAEAQRLARDAGLRDVLVREVHHRIKNNLQGVMTLIQGLAAGHPESAGLLEAAVTRLDSIASVYGLLSVTGEGALLLDQLLLRLVSSLKNLHADLPVQLSVRNATSARVTEREAVPLALIINELIMNAIKHSRASMDGKPVEVVLEGTEGAARVVVRNSDGRLPGRLDFDAGTGLGGGLSLVRSLLPPEGARLRFQNTVERGGAEVELTLIPPVIAFAPPTTTSTPSTGREPELGARSDR